LRQRETALLRPVWRILFRVSREFSEAAKAERSLRSWIGPDKSRRARQRRCSQTQTEVRAMLSWVVTFLIIALIAGVLGFGGIAGASIGIAKIIFFIAIVLFLLSLLTGVVRRGRP
jgi:uncharacterized membrane protein YtjA (UPF0391 family)